MKVCINLGISLTALLIGIIRHSNSLGYPFNYYRGGRFIQVENPVEKLLRGISVEKLLEEVAVEVRYFLNRNYLIKDISSMTVVESAFTNYTRSEDAPDKHKNNFWYGRLFFIQLNVKNGKGNEAKDSIVHIRVYVQNLTDQDDKEIEFGVRLVGIETNPNPYPRGLTLYRMIDIPPFNDNATSTPFSEEIQATAAVQRLVDRVELNVRDELYIGYHNVKDLVGRMTAIVYKFTTYKSAVETPKDTKETLHSDMGTYYDIQTKIQIGEGNEAKDKIYYVGIFEDPTEHEEIRNHLSKRLQLIMVFTFRQYPWT